MGQWCDWAVLGRKPEKGRAVQLVVLSVQNLLLILIFLHKSPKLGTPESNTELVFVFPLSPKAAPRCWQRFLVVLFLPELLSWGTNPGVPGLWEGGAGAESGELCCCWLCPWVLPSIYSWLLSQNAELKGFLLLWSNAAVLFPGPLRYSLLDLIKGIC